MIKMLFCRPDAYRYMSSSVKISATSYVRIEGGLRPQELGIILSIDAGEVKTYDFDAETEAVKLTAKIEWVSSEPTQINIGKNYNPENQVIDIIFRKLSFWSSAFSAILLAVRPPKNYVKLNVRKLS